MSFRDRIKECSPPDQPGYLPFSVAGTGVGFVMPAFARVLADFPDVFKVTDAAVVLSDAFQGFDDRTAAVAGVLEILMDRGHVPGWRGEHYGVGTSFGAAPFFSMERAAVPLFGVIGYGVHLNGVVAQGDGLAMWIGRRSLSKPTGPGKLDQIVAGGQPVGISVFENLLKECAEEADIAADMAAGAIPVGTVSYVTERAEGLRRDVLFIYDLVLPEDFEPRNTDGEIEDFRLIPLHEVSAMVHDSDDFKFNCSLVVIDFLMRHGYIDPDHPDYMDILEGLRSLDAGTRILTK